MILALLLAAVLGYPRTACFGIVGRGVHAWQGDGGAPFLDANGRVNMAAVREHAMYDVLILNASQLFERPDIVDSLRAQGTGVRILGNVAAQVWDNPPQALLYPDTSRFLEGTIWRSVTSASPHWRTIGRRGFFDPFYGPNSTNPDRFTWAMVNYAEAAVADSFAAVVGRHVRAPLFDGCFVDLWHPRYGYMQGVDSLNLAAMGWSGSLAAYDSASLTNHVRATAALARATPLVVNGVHPAEKAWCGSMRENFPNQWGGSWVSNMIGPDNAGSDGYLHDHDGSFLNVLLLPNCAETRERARIIRFGFASAALGEGFATFTCINAFQPGEDRAAYWPEEAAIDLRTHRPSRTPRCRHWLGAALGPARLWKPAPGGRPGEGVWRRDFEHGTVLVNGAATDVPVRFERHKWRIIGSGWPNTGGKFKAVTVPAHDGLFVLNRRPKK